MLVYASRTCPSRLYCIYAQQ